MENELISRKALLELFRRNSITDKVTFSDGKSINETIETFPAVDAVEVDVIRAWLYEIAMNNTKNYLSEACEEIISRLDGLKVFARERKGNG